ncbi:MAG: hypothetical protein NC902_07295, partial [Candidatus Omnitrophica bacterium]|nr:hypothetical protein [Candidatus Omnitrophota bacterium]
MRNLIILKIFLLAATISMAGENVIDILSLKTFRQILFRQIISKVDIWRQSTYMKRGTEKLP